MLSDYQEILIEKFFRKEMSPEEREEFDLLIRQDQEFKETVAAQQIILDGLAMNSIKADVAQLMAEMEADKRLLSTKRRHRFIGIAACVLVLMVATTYAGLHYGWFDTIFNVNKPRVTPPKQEIPADSVDTVPKDTLALHYGVQYLKIHAADETQIRGGLGTLFRFGAASLLESTGHAVNDSVTIELVEILHQDELNKLSSHSMLEGKRVTKMFYLVAFNGYGPLDMNSLAPPKLLIPQKENFELYYGGTDVKNAQWLEAVDHSPTFIGKPSHAMEAYKRFIEGRAFLDSLRVYYVQEDEYFKPASGNGRTYTVLYVQQVEDFVNHYIKDPHARQNVLKARKEWQIYYSQRQVQVNRNIPDKPREFYIYQPGWYALVVK